MAAQLLCSTHIFSFSVKPKLRICHLSRKSSKMSASTANCSLSQSEKERRSANYESTIWTYNFLQSFNNANADELYRDEAKKLEERVRRMMKDTESESLAVLEVIDDIQRLGLGHRFQEDINTILHRISGNENAHKSLHQSALRFRLLRQHGYNVSHDVFRDFMEHNDDILASLRTDTKGMLSLYEASHLSFEDEDLLDKTLIKSTLYLEEIRNGSKAKSEIIKTIDHALELPLHKRMVMLESRWYIEAYSKREDADQILLQLAKLDFNIVQSVLQRDLKDMSRWWNSLGLSNKLGFSSDRLVECFFGTAVMIFEPQFSSCRKGLTKVASFITTIDDIYDVYGSLDELQLFTDAVERWDVNATKDLPDYMKLCFLAFFNSINAIAYESLKEQEKDIIPYLTKAWADLLKAFLQEAKWSQSITIPSFEEYLENGWRSVSGTVFLVHTYFLMDQSNSKEALHALLNYHDLLRWSSIIFRLSNDLGTFSAEKARGEAANSISCYMNEKGVSEEHAREYIRKQIDITWKKINQYLVDDATPFTKLFVETALNLCRISQLTYQYGDGHRAPDANSKKRVLSLIIEPILVK